MIWDTIREKLPLIFKRIIYFITYMTAIYVFIFYYDELFIKFLGLLFIPFMTCLMLFGRWKKWDSFKEFLSDFYQSDGWFFMSIMVIIFWILFM